MVKKYLVHVNVQSLRTRGTIIKRKIRWILTSICGILLILCEDYALNTSTLAIAH